MNAAKPSQIRLLVKIDNATKIKYLRDDPNTSGQILRSLGVENIHLFFSRHIVIVEGETEEQFFPAHYLARTQRTPSSELVKVINVQGINNVVGFARAILELHNPERIYILCDNDASPELAKLIVELNVPDKHKFYVGLREFEDAFHSNDLHECWKKYHEECGCTAPVNWTPEAIEQLKQECINDINKKFSKELKALNKGGKAMTKPQLGKILGSHIPPENLPKSISDLFAALV